VGGNGAKTKGILAQSSSCADSIVVWMPHAPRGGQNAQETSGEAGGKLRCWGRQADKMG